LGLFILSAVSGTGKSTLARGLVGQNANWQVSVSHTTRALRGGEVDGQHYHFCLKEEFAQMVEQGAFVEWAHYLEQCYGTSYKTVTHALEQGIDLLFDIEINGARQVKSKFPDAHSVFLLPPSFDVLKARLFGRATDDLDKIYRRLSKGLEELKYAPRFDHLVLNESIDDAMKSLELIRDGRGDELPDQSTRLSEIVVDMVTFLETSNRPESMF
jgi:guanylate kinase